MSASATGDDRLDGIKLTLVQSLDELDEFRRWLGERRPIMGVDTETTGLSLVRDTIRTTQFGDAVAGWTLPQDEWRGAVREVMTRYKGPMVFHNIKFDAGKLIKDGLPFPWARMHDTMPMLHLVNSLGPKALKPAAALHIGPKARAGQKSLGAAMMKHGWTWSTVPVDFPLYWAYGAMDTCLTAILAEQLWPQVQPYREAYDLEMACSRVLTDMEIRGIRIDTEYVETTSAQLLDELGPLTEKLGGLNPNSPTQIIGAMIAAGAKMTKRTDKGQLSTDDEVLSELAAQGFELAGLVLESRSIRKITGTWFRSFLRFRDSDDLIHASINQFAGGERGGAGKTGRMSVSGDSALQTLPRKALVRNAIVAREGNALALFDYDNEELRVAAHFSGDERMLAAFSEGRDLHTESAIRIYGTEQCNHEAHLKCIHRQVGKTGMFSKAYGAGIPTFSDTVGLPVAEAAVIYRALDEIYPGMARTMAQVTRAVQQRAKGGETGFVTLIDGRQLRVPADKPYMGFNYLIQGSCATVLKRALVDLDLAGFGDYMVLPIHDEVVFDIPTGLIEDTVPQIKEIMTRRDFRVPLTVGSKIVKRWGEAYA
jgi:DNA polymerase I